MDLTRQEQEEEKLKYDMKKFDCADNPIKEWLSTITNIPGEELFDDYNTEGDILRIEIGSNHYSLLLSSNPKRIGQLVNGSAFKIKHEKMMKNEKYLELRRATSLLYDAVRLVYTPVVCVMKKLRDKFNTTYVEFDEQHMCFSIRAVNKLAIEKKQNNATLYKIHENFNKISHLNTPEADNLRSQLLDLQAKTIKVLNNLTEEKIQEQNEYCKQLDEELKDAPKLYIILDKNVKPDDSVIMKRLPTFGLMYQDPDEENYIDILKKELDVTE